MVCCVITGESGGVNGERKTGVLGACWYCNGTFVAFCKGAQSESAKWRKLRGPFH